MGAARKESETPARQKLEAPVEKDREEGRPSRAEITEEEKLGLRKPCAPKKKAARKPSHTQKAPGTEGTRVGGGEEVEKVKETGKRHTGTPVKNRWGGVEPERLKISSEDSSDESSDDESMSGRNKNGKNEKKDIKKASLAKEEGSDTGISHIEVTSATPTLSEQVEHRAASKAEEDAATDFLNNGDTAPYLPEAMRDDLNSCADEMLIHILQLANNPREWLDFLSVDDYEIFQGRILAKEFGHATAYDVLVYMFGKMNDDPFKQYHPNLFEYDDIKIVLRALGDPETARTPAAIWSPYSVLAELCRKEARREIHQKAKEHKKLWTAIVDNAPYLLLDLDERRFPLRAAPGDFSYVVLLVMTLACERQLRQAQTLVVDDNEHFQMYQHRVFSLLERLRKDKYPHDTVLEIVHIWEHLQNRILKAYGEVGMADDVEDTAPTRGDFMVGSEDEEKEPVEQLKPATAQGKKRAAASGVTNSQPQKKGKGRA
jgi:hypothetical protein